MLILVLSEARATLTATRSSKDRLLAHRNRSAIRRLLETEVEGSYAAC